MKNKKTGIIVIMIIVLVIGAAAAVYLFALRDVFRQIKVESFEGDVTLYRTQKKKEIEVYEGQQLISGDRVTVGEDSLLVLQIDSDKYIAAESDTSFELEAFGTKEEGMIRIHMICGEALFTIENKLAEVSGFEVTTPNHAILAVRGTVFRVSYDDAQEEAKLDVVEGTVHAECQNGDSMDVSAGESVIITEDGIAPVISIANAGIGDIVTFGVYEQDDDKADGMEPIEWIVLEKGNNEALLLSLRILDCHAYDDSTTGEPMTWERCGLRNWLNDSFYQTAFSAEEQEMIVQSHLTNPDNPGGFSVLSESCPDTSDNVFILSLEEAKDQYVSIFSPLAEVTAYAQANGTYVSLEGSYGHWWLRTPGIYGYFACYVADEDLNSSWMEEENYINDMGENVYCDYVGVRPAIKVTY